MRPRHGRDDGAAAIELGVLLAFMVLVVALIFPLGEAFYYKMALGRAGGDTIRFATSAPNTPEYGSSGRRPTPDEIKAEASRAFQAAGGSTAGFGAQVNASDVPG